MALKTLKNGIADKIADDMKKEINMLKEFRHVLKFLIILAEYCLLLWNLSRFDQRTLHCHRISAKWQFVGFGHSKKILKQRTHQNVNRI